MKNISEMEIGEVMGISPWLTITQEAITAFGINTKDVEPLHTDAEWCKINSPYKVPIAYGFQTISMLTWFMHEATGAIFSGHADSPNFPLNYGFNRLRLITPVRVGTAIRAIITLGDKIEKRPGELLITFSIKVEIEHHKNPALVADWLLLWVTGEGTQEVNRSLVNQPKTV